MKRFGFELQREARTNRAPLALSAGSLTGPALAADGKSAATAGLPTAGDSAIAIAAQRAWWTGFIVADTAHLATRSAPQLSVTISGGHEG